MIPTLPVTEASVAAAKAAMYRERWEVELLTGLRIDEYGQIGKREARESASQDMTSKK